MGVRYAKTEEDIENADLMQQSDDAIYANVDKHINSFCKYLSLSTRWNQERFDASQRELIQNILFAMEHNKNVILELPTGTGKSIIAMFIAAYYHSFILTSDKMLQHQYDDFIDNVLKSNIDLAKDITMTQLKSFTDIVMLKGRDNYKCAVDSTCTFSTAQCQEQGLSFKEIAQNMQCHTICPYIIARQHAINAQSTILNYAFWLLIMNRLEDGGVFGIRDATIFDECHKLDDILASYLDIAITPKFIQDCTKAESLIAGMYSMDLQQQYAQCKDALFDSIKALIQQVSNSASVEIIRDYIKDMSIKAAELFSALEPAAAAMSSMLEKHEPLTMWHRALKHFISKIIELSIQIEQILDATETEPSSLIVLLRQSDNSVHFKCTNDALLASKLLHPNCRRQVFMSATIGDIDKWANLNAISNYESWSLESDWQFKHSPIRICTPLLSLSHANYNNNLPTLLTRIDTILEMHPNENGVIHCATKKLANYIVEHTKYKDRCVTYSNTYEKLSIVEKVLVSGNNKVLVAYSATEGISLDDDKCRFQIIAKLSWQNLGDIVVKTKADNKPEWYMLKTLQALIQAIGRGIRHANDWCVTYILDSSFTRLQKSCNLSNAIQKRLITFDILNTQEHQNLTGDDFFSNFL